MVSSFEFEYTSLIGKLDFSTLSWILFNTFFTTNVFPVPGLPYTSKFEGLDFFKIGRSDWVTCSCSESLCWIIFGIKVKWRISLFFIIDRPDSAASSNRSIGSDQCHPTQIDRLL